MTSPSADLLTYDKAIRSCNTNGWLGAVDEELNVLEANGT